MDTQERAYYYEQGYSDAQIDELSVGKNAGLDISVYEDPKLSSMQMYQLRLGLESGLNMRPYADGSFDWFQIEEIRKGLEDGLDVSRYAKPDMSSECMQEMRLGLSENMDLSDYIRYGAGVMQQIRTAFSFKIDVTNYAVKGYDANQIKEIRLALAEGLDIHQYLEPEFRAVSISEIAQGLRDGVDVEIYAKPDYTWTQMREIRLGLLGQLDISYYQSPLFDRYQMEQIRLGLEDGLEVDEYASHMYPAHIMASIRKELLQTGVRKNEYELSADEANAQNKDGIFIQISEDQMTAFLRFDKSKFGITTRKDILRSLRVLGITQNIDPRMLDDLLSGKHLNELVKIASGRPAVDGSNGYYEYFFEVRKERKPKMNEDGSVNFQDIEWCEEVKKDQKLAYYHSAGNGEAGATVTGKRIAPKKGRELKGLRCKGVHVLEDKKTYIADFDGQVELSGFLLEVSQTLRVPEVTLSTGNIRFEGNVEVMGDVTNGTKIEAGGDVIINGFVEGATIETRGNVILAKGVNGGGRGVINAEGSVEGQFFESVNVRAGGDIKINYSLHSNIYSDASITVFGRKGVILGGTVFAANSIKVNSLGNASNVKSIIKLGISDAMRNEMREIEEKSAEIDKELMILDKAKNDMEAKFPPEVRDIMEMYIKVGNAIYTLDIQKTELGERKEELQKKMDKCMDAELVVTGIMYDGNIVDIDGKKLITSEVRNVTVKRIENRVGVFQN